MRVLRVGERDDRYVASLEDAARPVARAGEVLVRVVASGVNRADLLQIAGRYPSPSGEPEGIGLEVSGTTEPTGQPVCALVAGGGHAEYVAAPAGQVFPAPPARAVDLVAAAGIPEAYVTAFLMLVVEGGLGRGATLLVHAGASGVGLAAIQLGKLLGARVAASTRSPAKLAALTANGADLAIDTGRHDFVAHIEATWGRDAVDVVLDPIGAASLAGDLRVLATGGRIVVISTLSGTRVEVDLALLMRKRARLIGSHLRARSRPEKAALVARFREEVLPGFASGALHVTLDSALPVDRAAEAFQRMHDNGNVGKMVLTWPGD